MSTQKQYPNPYPGLRAFESAESNQFFGRSEHINDILAKLKTKRFLSVLGTSGSGKSSLIKGGVLPRLRSLTKDETWIIVEMRPSTNPVDVLATQIKALNRVDVEEADQLPYIEAQLHRSSLGLINLVEEMELAPWEHLLIVVDQFEEIFRYRKMEREAESESSQAEAFINMLLQATQQQDLPIYTMLTMRSDFLGDCAEFHGLPEAINHGQYLIPRMNNRQLREVIEMPLHAFKIPFQQVLVNRILYDLDDNMDQLPILQHALMRTVQMWHQDLELSGEVVPLSMEHYEAAGTLHRALCNHADEAYEALPPKQKVQAKIVFQALTELGEDGRGIRRPQTIGQLLSVLEHESTPPDKTLHQSVRQYCENKDDEKLLDNAGQLADVGPGGIDPTSKLALLHVLQRFRSGGRSFLLPTEGELRPEMVMDISHESLMRVWDRLRDWIHEEKDNAAVYSKLRQASHDFIHPKIGGCFYQGSALSVALEWRNESKPTAGWAKRYGGDYSLALTFLKYSELYHTAKRQRRISRQQQRLRMARARAIPLVIVAVVACLSTGWIWHQKQALTNDHQQAIVAKEDALEQLQEADSLVEALQLKLNRLEMLADTK